MDDGDGFVASANAACRGPAPPAPPPPSRGGGGYSDYGRYDDRRGRFDDRYDAGRARRDDRYDAARRDDRDRRDGRRRDDGSRRDDSREGRRRDDGGRRDDSGRGRRDGGRGRRDGRRERIDRAPTPYVDITCQICKIHGHPATDCWWRYQKDGSDSDGEQDDKAAHMASYGVDTNWYPDSRATDHITGELHKLTTQEKYEGRERVHTADGKGMVIKHIGHSTLCTPHASLHLKNILHVPSASKNLLSVHKLTHDNDVFLEFHPFFFLIKDQATRRTLFKGPCHGGLYPLVPFSTGSSSKHAFLTIKPSSSTWHCRLGHPPSFVVQQVLRKHTLSHSPEINPYICDSCQLAKSHQLPYPVSTSISSVPLEQVFSDVWGPPLFLLASILIM